MVCHSYRNSMWIAITPTVGHLSLMIPFLRKLPPWLRRPPLDRHVIDFFGLDVEQLLLHDHCCPPSVDVRYPPVPVTFVGVAHGGVTALRPLRRLAPGSRPCQQRASVALTEHPFVGLIDLVAGRQLVSIQASRSMSLRQRVMEYASYRVVHCEVQLRSYLEPEQQRLLYVY